MKCKICVLMAAALLFTACATNTKIESNENQNIVNEPEIISEPEDEIMEEDYSDPLEEVTYVEEVAEVITEILPPEPTAEEIYLEKLQNINLSIVSYPKEAKKGFAFSEPFVCLISDNDGNPVTDYEVIVTYPESRKNDEFTYGHINIKSDEEGKVVFTPEDNSFSAKSEVTFMPGLIETEDSAVISAAENKSVKAPWLVKTSFSSAILFVWEYNELNKPTGNPYGLISELKKNGIWNVGNAPVNDKTDINKSKDYLYEANEEIVGKSFEYLIGGTVKFDKPVEKIDDGYEADLTAEIYVINMKNGKVIYETAISKSATGANWNKAVEPCKDELFEAIVSALFYGL